ncbi:glycosyl transferase family 4 [Rhodanobacter sp. FW510-R12]|uniref:MraY family glycosyltransferase n=1 Tax=unclassified Rhodanobacter TaxID=2621553 RepID=UPI0007AA30EE|nr:MULTISPECIES: glycosyltransferase family 4 protein [unclassified Rhodanobacter]KZC18392.1 glycosyl transferase family 4 [Rhodanobacter sp. FW104-R8]KZC29058.1 glycosyl transferase family 4 [Rhodanobacter sp. FW510-T8]KZC29315.1 glycosyl transferase family 4 [Rhodanobacter sp. FW510-R10]
MYTTIGWLLAGFSITVLLVRGAVVYARRRGMLDQPGQRRSHRLPTPRGGGIGIVVAMLICLPGVLWSLPAAWPGNVIAGLCGALLLVALAGWWDDHRSLPALPRLAAQLLGVGLFSSTLLATGLTWWWLPLLLLAGAWSVNLHNFMDGIDGLLAQQAIFVGAGLGLLAWSAAQPALALAAALLAAAALGFWCFNRPPARIFMGDVGSGSLGLLVFAFSAMLWRVEHALLWPALILSSAFVADASLTLLTRIRHGRRWYTAHREHLYQWLVRRGGTHAGAGTAYLGWNLLIAAPLAWLARSHLHMALPITIAVYLGATAAWLSLKRRCLRRHQPKGRHVAA